MAAGEVLLSGSQLGTVGNSGFPLSGLIDANNLTAWFTSPATNTWAGQDAGAACILTRARISAFGGAEDLAIGGTIQGSTTPTFGMVQGAAAHINATNQASVSKAFVGAQTAGNANVVFITTTTTAVVSSVTDTSLNTYNSVASGSGGGVKIWCYVATNIAAAAAGANTVLASFSTNSDFPDIHIQEYPLIVTVTPFDVSVFATGTGTAVSSGPATTTNANDILIAHISNTGSATATAGAGWLMEVNETPGWGDSTEDQSVTATGSYTATATLSTSQTWSILLVALKLTSALTTETFFTIPSRPASGTLQNEYLISTTHQYRYFRYQAASSNVGLLSDLDFIVQSAAGITAQCATPTIASPAARNSDGPLVVTLACITTDAVIHYTLDGTTPTASSPTYTGPFVINTTSTLQAIGISASLANSRVLSTIFTIPSAVISTNQKYDDRNYPLAATINPCFLQDPVSGWWYLYVNNMDQVGTNFYGWQGINAYQSADLLNWKFMGQVVGPGAGLQNGFTPYLFRPNVLYNALNNNYVMWLYSFMAGGGLFVYTSPSPTGPFSQIANYTTLDGLNTSNGDFTVFLGPDGVTAYIAHVGTTNTQIAFNTLNASYTNVSGTASVYNSIATFGMNIEAPTLFFRNGIYFLAYSPTLNWTPGLNQISTSNSPLGPWSPPVNPFQQTANPDSLGNAGISYGITVGNSYTIGFDTQAARHIKVIPGRVDNGIYLGDSYQTGLPSNTGSQSGPNNLEGYRLIELPIVFPTVAGMVINWVSSWNIDKVFPTLVYPASPSKLNLSTSGAQTWQNNALSNVYLERANSGDFNRGFISFGQGATQPGSGSFTDTDTTRPATSAYRVRCVTAAGTSFSTPVNAPASNGQAITQNGVYACVRAGQSY